MHSRCKCIKGNHQASARILKLLVQTGNHGFMGVLFFKRFLHLGLSHFKKVMGGRGNRKTNQNQFEKRGGGGGRGCNFNS